MSNKTFKIYPAHVAGVMIMIAAGGTYFIHPWLSVALLLLYVVLCVAACFFPQTNFLGPAISHGRTGENKVALTFDDGPCEGTTAKILDLLDRHQAKATFFVTGINAAKHPGLIREIVRRGHEIGNHSFHHDPFIMLKGYVRLFREIEDAQNILREMDIETLAFRPPVGIVNPQIFPLLRRLELLCVTFSCRAGDLGNLRISHLAVKILNKVRADDIILLHDKPPYPPQEGSILLAEIEKILKGLMEKGLRVAPLSELIGKKIMRPLPKCYFNNEFND